MGKVTVDFSKPMDISIPLSPDGPRAWYVDPMRIEPVMTDRFKGSVELGGNVNFRKVYFNPHGHGTHTETVGHIDEKIISINKTLSQSLFMAQLITVAPKPYRGLEEAFKQSGDHVISKRQLADAILDFQDEALIIRTLPNSNTKLSQNYSNTNPPYFEPGGLTLLREVGVKHLLVDLPSVDREEDGGKLLAHRAYWHGGRKDDYQCTITEMIYVQDHIKDGRYLLDLQIAPLENDASPSKPILYKTLN